MVKSYNERMDPLPGDDEIIAAVRDLIGESPILGAPAIMVARRLQISGARRLGRGAVKGSWSGRMSGSLRIAPRLKKLADEGRLMRIYDRDNYRWVYR